MRRRSCEYRARGGKPSASIAFIAAAMRLSAVGVGLGDRAHAANEAELDVAYVEEVNGRVVAFSQGRPTLLEALDVINNGTRLDILGNSELRICHYRARQLLALKGPLTASISQDGVAVENSKAVVVVGTCAEPAVSTFNGGTVSRSLVPQPITEDRLKSR
jgi:hypothetical protein